ncbi:MAG TPA: cupin domain-containing protein [Anaerolineales bacterium]|nr:cupin domain-containing protein [Anaerolineales bacterium]
MASDLYQPFTNPITRETFRCISSTEEAFTMEWIVHPGGYVPFEHVHVHQDEIFHVQRGEIRARVKGVTQVGKAGDILNIPRGTRHIAFNDRDEPLVCIVDYKPGLDHYKAMQCFAGLTLDCLYDRRGLVDIPKILFLLKKANARSLTRPAFAPAWLFDVGMNAFFTLGSLLKWETLYQKYTE